jgi:hypothetical protein
MITAAVTALVVLVVAYLYARRQVANAYREGWRDGFAYGQDDILKDLERSGRI